MLHGLSGDLMVLLAIFFQNIVKYVDFYSAEKHHRKKMSEVFSEWIYSVNTPPPLHPPYFIG